MKKLAKDNFKSELPSNLSISQNFTALFAQEFEKSVNNPFTIFNPQMTFGIKRHLNTESKTILFRSVIEISINESTNN